MHTKTEIRKQKAHNFQQCSISTVKVSNTNSRVILANYNFDPYGIKTLFWKPDKAPLKSSVDLHIHTLFLSLFCFLFCHLQIEPREPSLSPFLFVSPHLPNFPPPSSFLVPLSFPQHYFFQADSPTIHSVRNRLTRCHYFQEVKFGHFSTSRNSAYGPASVGNRTFARKNKIK